MICLLCGNTLPDPPLTRVFLSERERQVTNCVLQSMADKEISAETGISANHVKRLFLRIFRKFGIRHQEFNPRVRLVYVLHAHDLIRPLGLKCCN